ncbi:MAG: type II secretion system F family protein [Methylococcales bacterium]|nr:type II secretion system F family protein [Methylococcales bacterium]
MDFLMQLLTGLVENRQESQWAVVLIVSGAVFILVLALMSLFDDFFDPVRSRFKREINSDAVSMVETNAISDKLRKYNNVYVPSDKALLQRTTMRLHYGGFHGRNSLLHYYAIRMLLMISLPLFILIVMALIPGMKGQIIFQSALVLLALGFMGPSFILDKLIANRQKTLRRAFPDALDLLVVCSEAGMSLDAAIQKVAQEISISQPVLADELNIVIDETRAGIDRQKALQRLVERTGVEDIKGLVATLSQSMRFGTSIVETLKVYSEDLRDKRTQAAEAVAAKIGTKLIFPLAVCLLPAFLMVVMVPALIIIKNIGTRL